MKINYSKIKNELWAFFILVTIAFTIKETLLEIYVVPTGSMEQTILPGDLLIGNKFIYGMRTPTWIGIPWTRLGFSIPWYRLPSFKVVKSGDIVIFEFPRDNFQKYVKRCIGISSDTIRIDSGKIYINNQLMPFPKKARFQNKKQVKSNIFNDLREQFLNLKISSKNLEKFEKFYKSKTLYSTDLRKIEDYLLEIHRDIINKIEITHTSYSAIQAMLEISNFFEPRPLYPYESGKSSSVYSYFNATNEDNIDEFVIPYKGMEIDFNKVSDWKSMITLLIQDKNKIELKIGDDVKQFDIIDPEEYGRMYRYLYWSIYKSFSPTKETYYKEYRDRNQYIKRQILKNRESNIAIPYSSSRYETLIDYLEKLEKDNKLDLNNYIFSNLRINGNLIDLNSKYKLKYDYYFFIGDNRDNSYDSRFWGFVPEYQILGVPEFAVINIFETFSLNFSKFFRLSTIK